MSFSTEPLGWFARGSAANTMVEHPPISAHAATTTSRIRVIRIRVSVIPPKLFCHFPNDLAPITGGEHAGGNVARDHAAGPDDTAGVDGHAGADDRAAACRVHLAWRLLLAPRRRVTDA